jgi:transcriptional regulator with XRE-family HTH domain
MNLARLREERGLTQAELAEMVGVSQPTITRAEQGHVTARLETYKKCADALGVSLAEIFADDRSALEAQLVRAFRRLPPDAQKAWAEALATASRT